METSDLIVFYANGGSEVVGDVGYWDFWNMRLVAYDDNGAIVADRAGVVRVERPVNS